MKHLLLFLLVPCIVVAQTVPSPPVSKELAPIVLADYLGYEPRPQQVAVFDAGPTSSVISTWNVTNTIPVWAAKFSDTNTAAAKMRQASLSVATPKWTRQQRFEFEIHFDMENRMRLQESKPTITKSQYFNALNQVWTNTP